MRYGYAYGVDKYANYYLCRTHQMIEK